MPKANADKANAAHSASVQKSNPNIATIRAAAQPPSAKGRNDGCNRPAARRLSSKKARPKASPTTPVSTHNSVMKLCACGAPLCGTT
jgi:hypothetical protein